MKRIVQLSLTLFAFITLTVFAEISPVGTWKTIDDVTGKPKAIVQIWLSADQKLFGKVLKFYPDPGHNENELCTACEGEKHNQKILGMVFLENLQASDNKKEWTGGTILDPKNGKVYRSTIQLVDNGQRLNVRGYIGIPLFGRTQTWLREK